MCNLTAETKKCTSCDRILPLTAFKRNAKSKDGYASKCKQCTCGKIHTNEELAKFTPRQLMDELAARGYHGTLTFIETHKTTF